jgi:hypothetical protein
MNFFEIQFPIRINIGHHFNSPSSAAILAKGNVAILTQACSLLYFINDIGIMPFPPA